jgi:hypothetical protein
MMTRTLDEIVETEAPDDVLNLLVIDAQGADLMVLKGATRLLPKVDGVFIEISEIPLYVGGCTTDEITAFLRNFGFMMKWMQIGRKRYGDAFYLRHPTLTLLDTASPNLALNKAASQSSRSVYSKENDAQGGNNGIRTGRYGFHTEKEPNPWWQVDLGTSQNLSEIRIFNRLDVASDRARSLCLMISEDGENWRRIFQLAGRRFGGIDGRPLRIPTSETARFVRVQLEDTQYLHLDQIEVY